VKVYILTQGGVKLLYRVSQLPQACPGSGERLFISDALVTRNEKPFTLGNEDV